MAATAGLLLAALQNVESSPMGSLRSLRSQGPDLFPMTIGIVRRAARIPGGSPRLDYIDGKMDQFGRQFGKPALASQDAQLHAAGCAKVYGEKVSGTKTDRAELARVLKRLETGDVLMVTRLDRLARSTRELLNILYTLGERGVGFKSLADGWANTTTPHGRLLVTMLAGIAEFERELSVPAPVRVEPALKPVGCVLAGRRCSPSISAKRYRAACGGRYAVADLARTYGVSQATISRLQPNPFGGRKRRRSIASNLSRRQRV